MAVAVKSRINRMAKPTEPVAKKIPTEIKTSNTWHDWHDVVEEGYHTLSQHYGVDMKELTMRYLK